MARCRGELNALLSVADMVVTGAPKLTCLVLVFLVDDGHETHAGITEEEAVAPFIDILMSGETTGNMTGAALSAVSRLVQAGAISTTNPLQQLLQVRQTTNACERLIPHLKCLRVLFRRLFHVNSSRQRPRTMSWSSCRCSR
jgi:hypothetical protein